MKFVLLVLFLMGSVFAKEGGNGGHAVVCRDERNVINWIRLLDIYEGEVLYKQQYLDESSVEDIVEKSLARLGQYPNFRKMIEREMEVFSEKIIFVENGDELVLTEDAFPPVIKKGCRFEQLAAYTEDGLLLISRELYEASSNLDKAALFMHESFYAFNRGLGDTNSLKARKSIVYLLADQFNEREFLSSIQKNVPFYDGVFKSPYPKRDEAYNCEVSFVKNKNHFSVSGNFGCLSGGFVQNISYELNLVEGSDFVFEFKVKNFKTYRYFVQFQYNQTVTFYYRLEDVGSSNGVLLVR